MLTANKLREYVLEGLNYDHLSSWYAQHGCRAVSGEAGFFKSY